LHDAVAGGPAPEAAGDVAGAMFRKSAHGRLRLRFRVDHKTALWEDFVMSEFATLALVLVAWIVLARWVLPMFGIDTCMSGRCGCGGDRCSPREQQPTNPNAGDVHKET
jgi:hypothetical protein